MYAITKSLSATYLRVERRLGLRQRPGPVASAHTARKTTQTQASSMGHACVKRRDTCGAGHIASLSICR